MRKIWSIALTTLVALSLACADKTHARGWQS